MESTNGFILIFHLAYFVTKLAHLVVSNKVSWKGTFENSDAQSEYSVHTIDTNVEIHKRLGAYKRENYSAL